MLNKKTQIFTRRVLFLGGIKAALMSTLIGRLVYLQIFKSDIYKAASDKNRIRVELLPPARGKLLDQTGALLASNTNYYRLTFTPSRKVDRAKLVRILAPILKWDDKTQKKMLKKIQHHHGLTPLILTDDLNYEDVAKIEVHAWELPNIAINIGLRRFYHLGNKGAHLLGYLGPLPKKELEANPLLNHPDLKTGKNGVEKHYESQLRGIAGLRQVEVNAFGSPIREIAKQKSQAGDSITLTIHRQLQQFVAERIQHESASVVVLDAQTGAVYSCVSSPSYDPNILSYGIDNKSWRALNTDLDKPLINKTIQHTYAPGSTFKTLVALAALKAGISSRQTVHCTGHVTLGRHRFHCWKKGGHGTLNMTQAIKHSCNSYFFTIARMIGINPITEYGELFHLGKALDFGLPNEKAGIMPSKAWKKKTHNQRWQLGDTLNVSIGQGFVLTTPAQLATMTARIASGNNVTPYLVEPPEGMLISTLDIPDEHLEVVRTGMRQVVNQPGGTAFRSRILEKGMELAGKTGTSQVVSKSYFKKHEHRLTEAQKKRLQHHGLFIGFAPLYEPRLAISVVVEHGGSGSRAAAPVAKDVLEYAQKECGL